MRWRGGRDVPQGVKSTCVCCGDDYTRFGDSAYNQFCWECRRDFNLNNDLEAKQLLDSWGLLDEAERKALKAEAKRTPGFTVSVPATPPAPKVDPEKIAAITRAMTSYGQTTPLPEHLPQLTNYVIAKNGLFEVRETETARILFQPTTVVGLTDELKAGIQLKLPKLPFTIVQQIVAFFRKVSEKSSCEAFVRVWWNCAEKQYEIRVPDQKVGGASVDHTDDFDRDGERDADGNLKYLLIMDVHSHGSSMTAFWSSTDDNDERKAPEGRMFGVIGKVDQPLPEWKWRMRTREGFIDLNIADLFECGAQEIPFTVTLDLVMRSQNGSADGRVNLSCPVDPFQSTTFPSEWLERVSNFTPARGMARVRSGGKATSGETDAGKQYIYIQTQPHRLEEFACDDRGMVSTGKFLELKKKDPAAEQTLH